MDFKQRMNKLKEEWMSRAVDGDQVTQYVKEQDQEVKRQRAEYRNQQIERAFGKRFLYCSFDNYKVTDPRQADAIKKMRYYMGMPKEGGESLLLFGKSGTGKTHLMVSMAKDMQCDMEIIQLEDLFEQKRTSQSGKSNWFEKLNRYIKCSFLMIPDLIVRSQGFTDSQKELLFYLFDERYKNFLPMVMATNVTIQELKKSLDFEGTNRISDRLRELIGDRVVCFDWESYRGQKTGEK